MARTLEAFPEEATIRAGRYPWNTWLNGEVWRLEHGTKEEVDRGEKDYSISTRSFRSAVTQAQKALNRKGTAGKARTAVIKEDKEEVGLVIHWVAPGEDSGE